MVNIQIITKGFNNGDSGTTTTWSSAPCLEGKVGDGLCDDFNNKAECEFDQGKTLYFYYSRNYFTASLNRRLLWTRCAKGLLLFMYLS